MTVKIEMDMPKICAHCPMFEKGPGAYYVSFMGEPLLGKCKALPIKDLRGTVISYQVVSTRQEIEAERRSEFCPLKEVEK